MTTRSGLFMAMVLFTTPLASAQSVKDMGQVTGRVLNSAGSPAVGIEVVVIAAADARVLPAGHLALGPNAVVVRTDAAGQYRMPNVSSGSYHVAAGVLTKCGPGGSCAVGQWIRQPTFFPGVAGLAAAKPVVVTSGNVTADFRLANPQTPPAPGGK
jgi:hypothetical protein